MAELLVCISIIFLTTTIVFFKKYRSEKKLNSVKEKMLMKLISKIESE